jgi:hypothetical protein
VKRTHLWLWTLTATSVALASCAGGPSTSDSLPLAATGGVAPGGPQARSDASSRVAQANAAATPEAVPFPSKPDTDPFYAQPKPFPKLAPGTILASRAVTFAPYEDATLPNAAWQLKFVSRDTNDLPIAAVATVVKPLQPAPEISEPLLVFAYPEDSLGAECAPSHSLTGSQLYTGQQDYAAVPALNLGWTLVYPDSEGPQSAYASGPLAAHIGFDSARAAEHFAPLGLNSKTAVGFYGYSGGAFVSAWAATLEQTYAPDMNVVGIASGGTPANPGQIVQNIDTNRVSALAGFSLIMSAIIGVNRSYPELATPILNAKGVAAANALANGCGGSTTGGAASPSGSFNDYTTSANPLDSKGAREVLPQITLPLAHHAPIANVFVYHSQVDELIPIAGVDAMVSAWCAAGSQVEYYRGVNGEHVTFGDTSGPLAIAYLESRFYGTGPPVVPPGSSTCNQGAL